MSQQYFVETFIRLCHSMPSNTISTPPSVSWAQRRARVYLKINVECKNPVIKIDKTTFSFRGTCAPDNNLHEVSIPLYGEVDPETSNYLNKGRLIEVILTKYNAEVPYWPNLTNDKEKHHWLKIDFDRWQDEDEDKGESGDYLDKLNDMFANMHDGSGDKDDSSSSEAEDLPDVQ